MLEQAGDIEARGSRHGVKYPRWAQ
jgi:hypothetical protein